MSNGEGLTAGAGGGTPLGQGLDALKELLSPEMIRALSPTEGFETKPHTFQAVEDEGRWKTSHDFGDRALALDAKSSLARKKKKLDPKQPKKAVILRIEVKRPGSDTVEAIIQAVLKAVLPQSLLKLLPTKDILRSLTSENKQEIEKALPGLRQALEALGQPSVAEIEALWWSDGIEIWAGQAAARHVTGFNSLFGHQARVDLDGVSFGNYFPLSYCLTFTGFVNPIGPTFEEFRGAVRLTADGTATGLFCEKSNRDEKHPQPVNTFLPEKGYELTYN